MAETALSPSIEDVNKSEDQDKLEMLDLTELVITDEEIQEITCRSRMDVGH